MESSELNIMEETELDELIAKATIDTDYRGGAESPSSSDDSSSEDESSANEIMERDARDLTYDDIAPEDLEALDEAKKPTPNPAKPKKVKPIISAPTTAPGTDPVMGNKSVAPIIGTPTADLGPVPAKARDHTMNDFDSILAQYSKKAQEVGHVNILDDAQKEKRKANDVQRHLEALMVRPQQSDAVTPIIF